jgi:hypothetical protein
MTNEEEMLPFDSDEIWRNLSLLPGHFNYYIWHKNKLLIKKQKGRKYSGLTPHLKPSIWA